jgi:Cytochrome c7 and related cytochrome c/Cytochrome c554 and c-prime
MRTRIPGAASVTVAIFLLAGAASAQTSRCADCHIANPDAPAQGHVSDWSYSAHRRGNVGCEACHGGDPSTFDLVTAHRDVLYHANPASPVNRRNLPATCGKCHAGPFTAFQQSRHYALLESGDMRTPTCTTCHGDAGLRRPSPRAIEAVCAQCHGPNGRAPRPERAQQARAIYQAINTTRDQLDAARRLIDRVKDRARRDRLNDAYQQAEVPLEQAIQAGHEFVYADLQQRLDVASQRANALMNDLANTR